MTLRDPVLEAHAYRFGFSLDGFESSWRGVEGARMRLRAGEMLWGEKEDDWKGLKGIETPGVGVERD